MWARWQDGWTLQQIGKLFDRPHTSVQKILSKTGGIRPPERRRCATALTLLEREEISRALMAGQSMRSITVSRSKSHACARNSGKRLSRPLKHARRNLR